MKALITGGTGFVGSALTKRFLELGYQVTAIGTRSQMPFDHHPSLRYISADTTLPGDWQNHVAGQDVLINLAGRSVFHLWTTKYKEKLQNSRIQTTRNLVDAIPGGSQVVLLSSSAAGFYGDGGEVEKTESDSGGTDFLATLCKDWEAAAFKAYEKGTRVAIMRFGVVLGKGGGAIGTMRLPFKLGLGGPIGSGKQWFPWIHINDLLNGLLHILHNDALDGVFNFTAPEAVRQKEFAGHLASTFHRPAIIPAPGFMMKLILGEFGSSLLQGQKVRPRALEASGYVFSYPTLVPALREIVGG